MRSTGTPASTWMASMDASLSRLRHPSSMPDRGGSVRGVSVTTPLMSQPWDTKAHGGGARSSTRCTSAVSRTETAMALAISPGCDPRSATWPILASTPYGSTRGTRRRWPTPATTCLITGPWTLALELSPTPKPSLREAHDAGLRVILDIVPNHTSTQHPWFQAALAAPPGSAERRRYLFRPGRGDSGEQPPNNWRSMFGGSAWTRVTEADGRPGEWYLHLFAPEQPDLDWRSPDVRADFETTLRFWFDRGVDGFRIDVANSLTKQEGLPDLITGAGAEHPHFDRDDVHEIYRQWRTIADSYPVPPVFVAEAWVDGPDRLARYVRADELHTAFNFDFLRAAWTAPALRTTIEATIAEHAAVGAPPTWVLSNHDVARHLSRYARVQSGKPLRSLDDVIGQPADLAMGARRARAAALLMLALPGGAYVYQGEELGLPEVEDLPSDVLADPTWARSGHTQRGRDGCRVPIPWEGDEAPFGFSPKGARGRPWLPQPRSWRDHTVAGLEIRSRTLSSTCTEAPSGSAGPSRRSVTAPCGGCPRQPTSCSSPGTPASCAPSTCQSRRSPVLHRPDCSWPADR